MQVMLVRKKMYGLPPYLGIGKFGSTAVPFSANCKVDEFWIASPRLRLNRGLENILHIQKTTQIWRKGRLLKLESLDWEVLIWKTYLGQGSSFPFP